MHVLRLHSCGWHAAGHPRRMSTNEDFLYQQPDMGVFSNAHLCLPTWDDGSKEGYHLQPATLMFTKPRSLSLWGTCFLLTPKRSVSFPIHNRFCQSIVAPSATSPPGSRCSRCSSTALFGSPHCFEERVHQNFGMAKMFRFSSLSMAID